MCFFCRSNSPCFAFQIAVLADQIVYFVFSHKLKKDRSSLKLCIMDYYRRSWYRLKDIAGELLHVRGMTRED